MSSVDEDAVNEELVNVVGLASENKNTFGGGLSVLDELEAAQVPK
ncbi:hypothetical protein [Neorhizobium galegae]|nr:hypothetical protein [Neorhizobium galegae]